MGRKAVYSTAAERQKAYRARLATRTAAEPEKLSPAKPKRRPLSRPARLSGILQASETLLAEYQIWRENLPESLAETDQAESLNETVDLLEQAIELLAQIQPPLGYGRTR